MASTDLLNKLVAKDESEKAGSINLKRLGETIRKENSHCLNKENKKGGVLQSFNKKNLLQRAERKPTLASAFQEMEDDCSNERESLAMVKTAVNWDPIVKVVSAEDHIPRKVPLR